MPPASSTSAASIMRNRRIRKSMTMQKFKKFEQKRMQLDTEDEPLNTQRNEEDEEHGMDIEHGTETKWYLSRVRLVESALFCMAFMGMGMCALQYEISFDEFDRKWGLALLWMIFISSIAIVILIIIRYKMIVDFKIARKRLSPETTIFNSGELRLMMLECVVFFIHPSPFLYDEIFYVNTEYNATRIFYHVNDLLTAFSMIRIIMIVRTLIIFSQWNTNRAQRLCEMYNCFAGISFGIKCMMEENPLVVVFTTYMISLPIFGFFIRIGERPTWRNTDPGSWNFNSYLDSIWCAIITLHTVGFGDYYAITFLGRIFTFMLCIWGSFITSVMVVTMTRVFELKSLENKAYILLKLLKEKDSMREEAAHVFTKLARLRFSAFRLKTNKDKMKSEFEEVKYHLKKLQGLYRFYKEFSNTDYTVDGIKNRLSSLQNDMSDLNGNVKYLIEVTKLYSNVFNIDKNVKDKFSFAENKPEGSNIIESRASKANFASILEEFEAGQNHAKRVRTKPTSISEIKDLKDMY
jgi:Ion channel